MVRNQALAAGFAAALLAGCGRDPEPLVLVIGLDGASLDLVDELRAESKLPTFARLMRSGVSGPLQSLAARRLHSQNTRSGFWSPVVWSSIATGKIPEKHGIRDFVLPIPGTSSVWIGSETRPPRATIRLPELAGQGELELRLRLHSYPPEGEQPATVLLNGEPLETILVAAEWTELSLSVSRELLRPVGNSLEIVFSRQSSPFEHGLSSDRRPLAAELGALEIFDERGERLFGLDPAEDRERLLRGFHAPHASLTEVQSVHWRAKPFWSLLSERGVPVHVIGYWGTWPAYEVNGRLVSSRVGIRDQRTGSERLTWPAELIEELEPLAPDVESLEPLFDRLHVSECEPRRLIDEQSVLKKILVQDTFYFRIAREFLSDPKPGLYSVYFRSIDVAGHATLHWRGGAPLREGCPESTRQVVDAVYQQVDRWVGELIGLLPSDASVLIVSDHGMKPGHAAGEHTPLGLWLARGPELNAGRGIDGATVLDVAPTVLQMFRAPIPVDMDGKVAVQLFDSDWLNEHPARYSTEDSSLALGGAVMDEGTEEALEQLRTLGYIE